MSTTDGRSQLKGVHEMIARKKKFADISNAADIEAALAEYDITTLEASLATAQQRRIDLLLTGSDDEILAAEDAATKARLDLDRAVATVEELTRRLEEARTAEAFAAAKKRRDDAATEVDRVVARIRSEYAVHALACARDLATSLPRLKELAPRLLDVLPDTIGGCADRLNATRREIEDASEFMLDDVAPRDGRLVARR
jgi:hypothetical protein